MWRRQWHLTPVLLPGKSHGRRSLVGSLHKTPKKQGSESFQSGEHMKNWGEWLAHRQYESCALFPHTLPYTWLWSGCSWVFNSVQFSHSVASDSLGPHGRQHVRLPSPSPTPRAYSNPCPLSRWCHPTISSSVVPFFSHLQSFPASVSFLVSQFFPSHAQSIGVSASVSVLPMNIQDWLPFGWTGWISLQSKGLSRVFSK